MVESFLADDGSEPAPSAAIPVSESLASWFKTRLYSIWSPSAASASLSLSTASRSAKEVMPSAAAAAGPSVEGASQSAGGGSSSVGGHSRKAQKPTKSKSKSTQAPLSPVSKTLASFGHDHQISHPDQHHQMLLQHHNYRSKARPSSPLRRIQTSSAGGFIARSASPLNPSGEYPTRSSSQASLALDPTRSVSPALSFSSTSAARHLSRLTDAQLAELAAQMSAELFRRHTPCGALLASYERFRPAGGSTTVGAAAAAGNRLAALSHDRLLLLASDLDAEAANRDIPGIDLTGARPSLGRAPLAATSPHLLRSATAISVLPRLSTGDGDSVSTKGPTSPDTTAPSTPVLMARSPSPSGSVKSDHAAALPPPRSPSAASTTADAPPASPMLRSSSSSASLRTASSFPRHMSSSAELTPEEERAALRSRLAALPHSPLRLLADDVRDELARRRAMRRAALLRGTASESSETPAAAAAAAAGFSDAAADLPAPPRAALVGMFASDAGAVLMPLEPAIRSLPRRAESSPTAAAAAASSTSAERAELARAVLAADLSDLWEDIQAELAARQRAAGSAAAAAAASAQTAPSPSSTPRAKRRQPPLQQDQQQQGRTGGESPNAAAWRARIVRLTDDQLAEVTSDVFDEITRRKEKKVPFLPETPGMSAKRNEARRELSKLPSRELKTL
ncbi:hypothetical protein HK405_008788, partial [Cladochytrium tenue]